MENETTIKTTTINLKELKNLKIAELNNKNGEDDFNFLQDDLTELLKEKLKEKGLKYGKDLKVFYSLSYCQGDGFCFIGEIETKKAYFNIVHNSRYYHEKSTDIYLIKLKTKNDVVYYEDLSQKEKEKADKEVEVFKELYINICKEMEKRGYNLIEEIQKENVLRIGFRDFLELNNIEGDFDLIDFDYSSENKKDFIQIAEKGNTYIKGLWIKPFNIIEKEVLKIVINNEIRREVLK